MNPLSFVVVAVLGGSPLPTALCQMTSVSIYFESQDGLDTLRQNAVVREDGIRFENIVAWEGEPIDIQFGVTVARIHPPDTGLTIQVFRNDEVVLAIPFTEWTQHGSTSSYEGADFASNLYRERLPPLPVGVYVFKVAPVGCDRARRTNYASRTSRVEVRRAATPRDQARLHMYRANRAASSNGDCPAALRELAAVDAYDPNELQAVAIRAACAKDSGNLEEAIALYEKLEVALDEMRRDAGPGIRHAGFGETIMQLRQQMKSRARTSTPLDRSSGTRPP